MDSIVSRAGRVLLSIMLLGSMAQTTVAQSDEPVSEQVSPLPQPQPQPLDQEAEWVSVDQIGPEIAPVTSTRESDQCKSWALLAAAKDLGVKQDQLLIGDQVGQSNGIWASNETVNWGEFPNLGVRACTVQVYVRDTKESPVAHVYSFLEDGTQVALDDMVKREEEAYQKRCGKYTPTLCAKVPQLQQDEKLLVSAELQPLPLSQVTDAVAERYPGLQSAKGMLLDPIHPDYNRALAEIEAQRAQLQKTSNEAFLAQLKALGIEVHSASELAPYVSFYVTRDQLPIVSALPEIRYISWADPQQTGVLMSSAVGSSRVQDFWGEGITGTNLRLAVVELDKIRNSSWLGGSILVRCDLAGAPEGDHATAVGSVVTMINAGGQQQGIAPGAGLISAGTVDHSFANLKNGADCAVAQQADVLNFSLYTTDVLVERYINQITVNNRRLTVASAGNKDLGDIVLSPATGINVLAVGGYIDQGSFQQASPGWFDDVIAPYSSFAGPWVASFARNKPEVVAVSRANVAYCQSGTQLCWRDGTSYSSPMVGGLALLIAQKTGFTRHPEIVKAIIGASAVHNIEGDSRLSDLDGMGAIDGRIALNIASNGYWSAASNKQGGYHGGLLQESNFDGGGDVHYAVPFTAGERVRIVLYYSADLDLGNALSANLSLSVYRPNGDPTLIVSSDNLYDNFEVVEFTADRSGLYDVRIHKNSWADSDGINWGIAWSRQGTYIPDAQWNTNNSGRRTVVYARNDGSVAREIRFSLLDDNGNLWSTAPTCANVAPKTTCFTYLDGHGLANGSVRSIVVNGSEDVTAMTLTENYTGNGPDGGHSGYQPHQAAGVVNVPQVMRLRPTASGMSTSDIMVFNVSGRRIDNVRIEFTPAPGLPYQSMTDTKAWIDAGGTWRVRLAGYSSSFMPNEWIGSARVVVPTAYNGDKVVVLSETYSNGNASVMSLNAYPNLTDNINYRDVSWRIPQFFSRRSNAYGSPVSSPIVIQNVSNSQTIPVNGIQVNCTASAGSSAPSQLPTRTNPTTIPPGGSFVVNPVTDTSIPTDWIGYCDATTGNSDWPIFVSVQIRWPSLTLSGAYEALPARGRGRTVSFPVIRHLWNNRGTSVTIRNLGNAQTRVCFNYTPAIGYPSTTDIIQCQDVAAFGTISHNHRLSGPGSGTEYHGLPDGWYGSLIVYSDNQPIAGYLQHTYVGSPLPAWDSFSVINGIVR